MNSGLAWFTQDINPSEQQWNNINKHLEDGLYYESLETQSFYLSNNSQEYMSCESQHSEETAATQILENTKKQLSDNNYQKNICAYISKKIVQYLINPKSQKIIRKFCNKAGCKYEEAMTYYTKRSKEVFGINHLSLMIIPQNQHEINMKRMFCAFLNWFLRNKYMFYMLKYGKMDQKEKYIEFKNKYLLYIVETEPNFQRFL